MSDIVKIEFDFAGNLIDGLGEAEKGSKKLKTSLSDVMDVLERFGNAALNVNSISDMIGGITSKIRGSITECMDAYKKQAEAETKLEQVMRNTMGATNADVEAIKNLAAAQQKLGVIGDEVQLAGAQELATYVGKRESLEKLMPLMNDMVAQQYGLNASQESAVNIATMMGKVMDGQVGALSRYGYKFDEAQEKILKFGTEEERAAVLAEVVGAAVGGVNEALAQTPEGQLKKFSDNFGDLQEKVGKLWTELQAKLLPVAETLLEYAVAFVEYIPSMIAGIKENLPLIAEVAAGIGLLTVAINASKIATKLLAAEAKIAAFCTNAWAAAQAVLNAVMNANPFVLIVSLILIVGAAIKAVISRTEGWSETWDSFTTIMKTTFSNAVDVIMIGIDKIKLGWYKFKEAIGLGDKNENLEAIRQISEDVEKRKRAIEDGKKKIGEAWGKAGIRWKEGEKKTLQEEMEEIVNGGAGSGGGTLNVSTGKSTEAVATGGTRSTTVNISIGDMIGKCVFNGGTGENVERISENFAEALSRALGMAAVAV